MKNQEHEQVITTTLTFDYFKADKSGLVARCVHTEVVEVFGYSHEQCFIETEHGREVHPELEKVLHPLIKHEKHVEKSSYHTVSWRESPRPASWFEHSDGADRDEDEDENGETVIEIDRKTGKFEVVED